MTRIPWQDTVDLNVAAPSFHRNPSAWSQRVPICILAGIATVIASYMALFQWGLIASVWDPLFGAGSMVGARRRRARCPRCKGKEHASPP